MISQAQQRSFMHRLFSLSCLILLGSILTITCRAQMGGVDPDPGSRGTGGRNTIDGRIYYPSGRNVDKRLKVKMTGIRGGDFFTMSDDTGAFSFRRVAAGTYSVSVDAGVQYEITNEQVDVVDGSSSRGSEVGRTYNLQIQLRQKTSGSEKPGIINAAVAGVPQPASDLYLKAREAERVGDSSKALEHLRRAVALYPEFALALNEMGVIYQKLGQLDQAAEALGNAVKVAPAIFELHLNYGIVLLKKRTLAAAEVQLRRAVEIKDVSTVAHLYRGKALIQLRKFPDAERELQQVIKLGGDDVPMAYRFLGALYNERAENKLAIQALEKYLSLAPNAKDGANVREIIKQLSAQSASK
jgi:tetratricopeptide (TPR) repeat protein